MTAPPPNAPRILLVRFGAMGDIVHSLPAAAALRSAFPDGQIDWEVETRWGPLLATAPHGPLNNVFTVDTFALRRGLTSAASWGALISLTGKLRAQRYDIAMDLQGAIKSAVACQLSGAAERYGFAPPWLRESAARVFYTAHVTSRAAHIVDAYGELVVQVIQQHKARLLPTQAQFPLPAGDASALPAEIPPDGIVVMNPGAGWASKQWPASSFARVADELASRAGRTIVLNCGPGEQELAEQVRGACLTAQPIIFSGGIPAMIALFRRTSLMLGPDTGPLHLAAALGVPTVGIFGPTDPARNGPRGPREELVRTLRAPQAKTSYQHNTAPDGSMRAITPEAVLAAIDDVIGGQPQS